jgi:hypothetical protein
MLPGLIYFDYFFKLHIFFNKAPLEARTQSTRRLENEKFISYLKSSLFPDLLSFSLGYILFCIYLSYILIGISSSIYAGVRIIFFLPFESLLVLSLGLIIGKTVGKQIQSYVNSQ